MANCPMLSVQRSSQVPSGMGPVVVGSGLQRASHSAGHTAANLGLAHISHDLSANHSWHAGMQSSVQSIGVVGIVVGGLAVVQQSLLHVC